MPTSQFVDLRTLPNAMALARLSPPVDVERKQRWQEVPWAFHTDQLLMREPKPHAIRAAMSFGTPLINQDGINYSNALPADPTGDVGELHYVQATNGGAGAMIQVYDKSNGTLLAGPILIESLGGSGSACQNGAGDPQVVYDGLANRWVLLELAQGGNVCIYVSVTSNVLATTWFRYEFPFSPFADYPKLAVWDSAYAIGANAATVVDAGNFIEKRSFFVVDRARMLQGQAATFQTFDTGPLARVFFGFGLALPVGLKGNNPPMPDAPITFLVPIDDELQVGGGVFAIDQLLLYTVDPDFDVPANTVVTGPASLNISDWSRSGGNAFQSNGTPLPMFTGVPMHRATYRNFGDRETMTFGFTSTFNQDGTFGSLSAVQWFELRREGGATQPWVVAQDGEYGRNFGFSPINRFIPAMQMDNGGNMALAYGVMSKGNPAEAIPPIEASLAYTGRLRSDAVSTMPIAETTIATGTQPQSDSFFRWGDYFDMSLDPDGCRFWFTGMYMDNVNWGTRIASWRHDSCGAPDFSLTTPSNPVTEVCLASGAQTIGPMPVSVNTLNSFWSDVNLNFLTPAAGVNASVAHAVRRPPASTTATVVIDSAAADGPGSATLRGVSNPLQHDLTIPFDVAHQTTAAPSQVSPSDAATNVVLLPTFVWNGVNLADRYVLEVSTSNTFATLAINQTMTATSFVPITLLNANTDYFWRIKTQNQCGDSSYSAVRTFRTVGNFCTTPSPTTVPDGGSLSRTVTINNVAGDMAEMSMRIVLNNGRGGDYRVSLSNGTQSTVLLNPLGAGCTTSSFRFIFDDADAATPVCGDFGSLSDVTVKPNNPLSVFNGHPANGTWTMTVEDTIANGVTGQYIFFCVNPIRTQTDAIFANGFE